MEEGQAQNLRIRSPLGLIFTPGSFCSMIPPFLRESYHLFSTTKREEMINSTHICFASNLSKTVVRSNHGSTELLFTITFWYEPLDSTDIIQKLQQESASNLSPGLSQEAFNFNIISRMVSYSFHLLLGTLSLIPRAREHWTLDIFSEMFEFKHRLASEYATFGIHSLCL